MIVDDGYENSWRLLPYYGSPKRQNRRDTWDLISSLYGTLDLPWCVVGDFNDMISTDEKRKGVAQSEWLIRGFLRRDS